MSDYEISKHWRWQEKGKLLNGSTNERPTQSMLYVLEGHWWHQYLFRLKIYILEKTPNISSISKPPLLISVYMGRRHFPSTQSKAKNCWIIQWQHAQKVSIDMKYDETHSSSQNTIIFIKFFDKTFRKANVFIKDFFRTKNTKKKKHIFCSNNKNNLLSF